MIFLLNNHPKFINPVFSQDEDGNINYKPIPLWHETLPFLTLSPLIEATQTAQADATLALEQVGAVTPKQNRVTMFHDEANSSPALTLSVSSLYQHNFVAFSTTQGFNAYHSFACDLMPACKLFFLGVKGNNAGILQIYLDDDPITTLDWYNSTTLNNQIQSISFAADEIVAGLHNLRLEVTSKHASSSGYALALTKYWLKPDVL